MIKLNNIIKENESPNPKDTMRKNFLEIISTFNQYGKQLKREQDLSDIAENLGGIANAARMFSVNEAEDWFDSMTVKKNMDALGKISEEFRKVASESKVFEDRMSALYDDMGHILSRYFEIADLPDEEKIAAEKELADKDSNNDKGYRLNTEIEKVKEQKFKLKSIAEKLKIQKNEQAGRIKNATMHVQMHKERLKSANEDLKLKKERVSTAIKKVKESKLRLKGLAEKYKTTSVNEAGPCWDGYQQIGMKMKNGKEVPNFVPKNEIKENNCGCNTNHDCGCGGHHKH